jgi:hypothetical protein
LTTANTGNRRIKNENRWKINALINSSIPAPHIKKSLPEKGRDGGTVMEEATVKALYWPVSLNSY